MSLHDGEFSMNPDTKGFSGWYNDYVGNPAYNRWGGRRKYLRY